MSVDRDDVGLAPNKLAGLSVEEQVIDAVGGLRPADDPDAHFDAVCEAALRPSSSLVFASICVLERHTLVEIKSSLTRYTSGCRGRFYFRPDQHENLLRDGGVYLFAVCGRDRPHGERDVLAMKIVPASIVDELIPEWFKGGDGRSSYAQLAWSRIFHPSEVPR
jgi:hypothetical protein